MEVIRLLVQNLIVIVVLALFLEMFLPQSDLRRYIRLVMGLLVIIAVLQAMSSLVRGEWKLDLPEQAVSDEQRNLPGLNEIMASGEKLSRDRQARALDEYRRALARQVSALASLSGKIDVLSAEVEIFDEPSSTEFGQIKKITLVLTSTKADKNNASQSAVKQVEIRAGKDVKTSAGEEKSGMTKQPGGSDGAVLSKGTKDKLVKLISSFYNLSPEQIIVTYQE